MLLGINPMELGLIINIAMLVLGMVGYMLPTIVPALRRHPQLLAIFRINFLLGWTVIGWIGALVWSLIDPSTPVTIPGSAIEIAKDRYARGEITASELEEIKKNIQ